MEIGPSGKPGQLVLSHVPRKPKMAPAQGREPAPTRHPCMAAPHVQDLKRKHRIVSTNIARVRSANKYQLIN